MKLPEIKVIEKEGKKEVFIDGVKQNFVHKVNTEILPGEITTVEISYFVDKFEVIKEEGEV